MNELTLTKDSATYEIGKYFKMITILKYESNEQHNQNPNNNVQS
jgi:hypothetical protein